ncbi:MAG TPA: methyltransferase [Kofleriaceae bacterium]|nr:methyltransferase [Kofleriaceae bacterium]
MDVFSAALDAGAGFLRDAAIAAAHDLGWFAARPERPTRRMRALLAVLDALDVWRAPPPRPAVPPDGWGRLAEVLRTDRPLAIDPAIEPRYQQHLLAASAPAAAELVARLPAWLGREPRSLIDLGGGAGAYTAAFLDVYPNATATLVDRADVVALAREQLARFGTRVTFVEGDARELVIAPYDIALLANVLHLHGPAACARLCDVAARAGELTIVKDLRRDTLQGLLFALGMAIYTDAGDVYSVDDIRGWLREAAGGQLVGEYRLAAAEEGLVLAACAPASELATIHGPPAFARVLTRALAAGPWPELVEHYTRRMPARRTEQAQLPIMHAPLDWARLPRLAAAIARLNAILDDAGVRRIEHAPTLAALYERTFYGRLMPLLYGEAHLAREGEAHAVIDRWLVAPVMHELCHLGPEREMLEPVHLDECVGGWLAVHVHPAFGEDDALAAAPWLAQVGQAVARAFGVRAVVRAHAGLEPLPAWFMREAEGIAWRHFAARRPLHLLADTLDPVPWVELALSRGLAPDPAFDRVIVRDALRAMCVPGMATVPVAPSEPVRIADGWMTCGAQRYWVPLAGAHELTLTDIAEIPALVDRLVG